MSPYPEIIELEGALSEVGAFADKTGYGVIVTTENGPISINGLDEDDVDRLMPGILGRVRITIEPIDEPESEDA